MTPHQFVQFIRDSLDSDDCDKAELADWVVANVYNVSLAAAAISESVENKRIVITDTPS